MSLYKIDIDNSTAVFHVKARSMKDAITIATKRYRNGSRDVICEIRSCELICKYHQIID